MNYTKFLDLKSQSKNPEGFAPTVMPDWMFEFQKSLLEWAVVQGRSAMFADCGLGKTPMQLAWSENVAQKAGKVLIITPLAVSAQTILEADKFGFECKRSNDGEPMGRITVTNYEKLSMFNPNDYAGVVCDESSILKSFDGARRTEITQFMKKVQYRLLCTATAAPNDYIELGTSSEALGNMGYMDMLNKFFKNDQNNSGLRRVYGEMPKWRFKGHAELPFWRWVTSWAKACRKPSDLGFDDGEFILPKLSEVEHIVHSDSTPPECLFSVPAHTLEEQRDERRRTVKERCQHVADLVNHTGKPALVWCHLNEEGDLLEHLIPDAIQVHGGQTDSAKESRLMDFANGNARVLVTKPKIGAWGLNFQHCAHITFFPSHSYEQYYQGVRRCWRFGQKNPVTVDIVLTEGEKRVMANLMNKSRLADKMFENLVSEMNQSESFVQTDKFTEKMEVPAWL